MLTLLATIEATGSPSSRRAWIEIVPEMTQIHLTEVALLTEGVDRNQIFTYALTGSALSPSSRRAWIEILCRW